MGAGAEPVVIGGGAFRADAALRAELAAVAAASFVDTTSRLDRELGRCDTLYLLRGPDGGLDCFFLVAHHTLDVAGRGVPALYLGLSAARPAAKGTGRVVRLYDRAAADARGWERAHAARLVVWSMTATPVVYRAARRVFAGVQPDPDGGYTPAAAAAAGAVRAWLGVGPAGPGRHPFVLPGVSGVRYTDDERPRAAGRADRAALLGRLGVDEARGDRLLLVARVPDAGWRTAGGRTRGRA